MNPSMLSRLVLGFSVLAPISSAQVAPTDEAQTGSHEETFFKGDGRSSRGDRHGKGFAEVLALKGEPLPPRFPEVGKGIERITLENGLVIYFAEDHKLPLISVEFMFRGGEAYEPEADRGLTSALCDRMRRGGIEGFDAKALDEFISDQSITLSARAGNETATVSMETLADRLDPALDVFSKLVLAPAMVKPADDGRPGGGFGGFGGGGRGGRGARNPSQLASTEFRKLVYGPDHPSARSFGRGGRGGGPGGPGGPGGGGTEGDTQGRGRDRFTDEQLKAAYARHIRPDQAVMVVSGDIDPRAMQQKLAATFGKMTIPADPAITKIEKVERKEPEIVPGKPGLYVIDVPGPQSAIVVGHIGVSRQEPDRHAITMMNDVLGGGSFSSRITERVRNDEGLAYSASSSYSIGSETTPGTFQCSVQTKTETTARAIQLLLEEIEKMRKPGSLSKNEFETARESHLYSFGMQFADRGRNVSRLAERELSGRPLDLEKTEFEGMSAVTPQAIEAAAAKHLRPADLYIVVAGDLKAIEESLKPFGEIHLIDPRAGRNRGGPPAESSGG